MEGGVMPPFQVIVSKGRKNAAKWQFSTKIFFFLKKFDLMSQIIVLYIYLFTATGLLSGGSGYFTCKQNMKLFFLRLKCECNK